MALLYAEETTKSIDHEYANGVVEEGDLVSRELGGGCHPTDAAVDDSIDAIVLHLRNADNIAEHEYDFRDLDGFTFDGNGDIGSDMCPTQPYEVGATWQPKTPEDETLTPPSIERNSIVGVAGVADGVIVEEGYTHDTVEYSEAGGGEFLPLGKADIPVTETVDGYGERVRVRLDAN